MLLDLPIIKLRNLITMKLFNKLLLASILVLSVSSCAKKGC